MRVTLFQNSLLVIQVQPYLIIPCNDESSFKDSYQDRMLFR